MVKHLRFLFVSMLMLICGNAMADEVTFDFNNDIAAIFPTITSYSSGSNATYVADGEFNEDTTSPAFGGVTVTVTASPADAGTRNRLWASAPRLRMYDGTLTFTSSGEKITKIVFTRSTNDKLIANSNTADSGELTTSDQKSNGVVTWTGEAQSVTITIKGNTQFSKAVVTLGEGGETPPVDPNALGQQNNPYTVAQAFEALGKLAVNVQSDEVYVKGKISKIDEVSVDNGNATYYISDDGSTNNQLYVYRGKFLKNADFTADDQIAVGDEVVVCGILVNYRSSKAAETDPATPEITQPNYIYMLNGKTEDDTPVTIEKAANISACKALAENTVAELTLTDAKVLYKNVNGQNTELFIRDASGAMDLYNMGMDSVTIDEQGAEPIQAELKTIADMKDLKGLTAMLADMSLNGLNPFLGIFGEADPDNSSMNIAWLWQSGLGIGDRDYYLQASQQNTRDKYVEMMTEMFKLSGYGRMVNMEGQEAELANAVLKLENAMDG